MDQYSRRIIGFGVHAGTVDGVALSDADPVKFGKMVRGLSEPRRSVTPDPWKVQLQEARAEWRRRHPKAEDQA
jgi:hypothetical protein